MLRPAIPFGASGSKKAGAFLDVGVVEGDRTVDFRVRLLNCPSCADPLMRYVILEPPPSSGRSPDYAGLNTEQKLWVRLLSYYEAKIGRDIDHIAASNHNAIINSWGLAYVALAYEKRSWLVERRLLSFKDAEAGKYEPLGEETLRLKEDASPVKDLAPEKVALPDAARFLAAELAGEMIDINADVWREYYEFERNLLNRVFDIINTSNTFTERMTRIRELLETTRKSSGDRMRLLMRMLQSHADTALMDIYAYAAEALLDVLEREWGDSDKLDRDDLKLNRYLHRVQEDLGGLVLALHPMTSLLLDSPKAIELLKSHVLHPEDSESSERFHGMIVKSVRLYSALLRADENDREIAESQLRDPDAPDKETAFDTASAPTQLDPAGAAALNDMHARILGLLADDPHGELFIDRFLHGLSVEEAAHKHGVSIGEVSKRVKRVRDRLKLKMKELGLLSGN